MNYYRENPYMRRSVKPVITETPQAISGQSFVLKLIDIFMPVLMEIGKKNIAVRVTRSGDHTSAELVFMGDHGSH